ncbi:SDR family oxidoreductase [Halomicronema sp. CCY15110]|uniref:SDR family oxidoreductase n=1 Tax=Halomicronema sp. CCY15110 TaxID=2767773 RepID=UPI00194FACE7|nr:SDR family oxidoreductase [Halomicronema sp. CCY15110]
MSKTVLITGASSGIGEATGKYFLQKGWNVSATMRSPMNAGDWTKAEKVICPRLDVTSSETIEIAVHETLVQFGRIDALVNNAGYALMGPLEGVTSEQLERQFKTNVFGLVSTIQKVLPVMRRQGKGSIINVASIGGRLAFPLASSYHATKWAVEGLSEALRYELRRFNIQVKIIEPGGIRTNFINHGSAWTNHSNYANLVERVKQFSEGLNDSLPGPEGVARTIYKAANDRSQRLRYSPHGEAFLLMHKILPDSLWRSLVAHMMFGSNK